MSGERDQEMNPEQRMGYGRRVVRSLGVGALAGLLSLALDELLCLLGRGFYLVPPAAVVAGAYAASGAAAAALLVTARYVRRAVRPSPPPLPESTLQLGALTVALVYVPALAHRIFQLAERGGPLRATLLAAAAVAGYGLWLILLRRLTPPGREPLALVLGVLSVAGGLAASYHAAVLFGATALAAYGAILLAALAVAGLRRRLDARLLALAAGTVAAMALIALAAVRRGPSPRLAAPPAAGSQPPNLVLVILDALRLDVFQKVIAETPEGQAFHRELGDAAWFTNAIAAAPWTVPAVGSIMTGLYPPEHGMGSAPSGDLRHTIQALAETVPTLAEQLARRGYLTLAIGTNGYLGEFSGVDRGFAGYEILAEPRVQLPLGAALVRAGLLVPGTYLQADAVRRRLGQRLGEATAAGRPLFLWLHLMEPHEPLQRHPDLPPEAAAAQLPEGERLYRDETRFALRELSGMFELLRRHGLWQPTVLVVVSDHGEMFPSDGRDERVLKPRGRDIERFRHGHALYGELVRIPLVIRPPGGLPGGERRIDVLTSHVDLHDTVADLLGLDLPRIGRDRVSLAPWLADTPPRGEAAAGRGEVLISGVQHGLRQRALRTPRFKLIEYLHRPRELYLLETDPGERQDLADAPTELDRLHRRLEAFWSTLEEPAETEASEIDEITRRRLEALGYLR